MAASKVPAAHSTLRILRYLAGRSGPVAAASIASSLELPRSSVYHLLSVMEEQGFVASLPEEHLYGLGVAAFELSGAYVRQEPLARLGRPLLARLVDEVGENAHLATLHGRDVVYVVEERAPRRSSLVSGVGVRIPAYRTASGRSVLAGLPREQVRALYPDRAAFADVGTAESAPMSPSALAAELRRTRARGWAVEAGDVTPGLDSVGVAVRDHRGLPMAGLAITYRGDPQGPDVGRQEELVGHLRGTAMRLAARVHGRTD